MKGLDVVVNRHLLPNLPYVNGNFVNGLSQANQVFPIVNPANGQILTSLPCVNADGTLQATKAANQAWKQWKSLTGKERGKYLSRMAQLMHKYSDDLAKIVTLESGKPFLEAKGEINYAVSFYEFYSEEARRVHGEIIPSPLRNKKLFAIKQPVGPAALITPWNFPSAMITRKVGPALAAGCSVVIKPSEETPLSALALCAIAHEAEVPPGIINCLTVSRDDVLDVGHFLSNSDLIRKLSFTGSTQVGKWLMKECASTIKKVSLELGGNAPFIVFDDADLDVASSAFMNSKFRNAGQACIASNRVLVQKGISEAFAAKISEKIRKNLKCGNGLNDGVTIGPLINQQGLDKVNRHVNDCVSKGAKVMVGGSPHHELNAEGGFFYNPTVLTGVTKDMLPYLQETFGPVTPLISFDTEEEAIAMANDTPFGLASYVCSKDMGRCWRVAEALETGMVGVNEGAISFDSTPFGGMKESGLGREGGHYGLEEYLEVNNQKLMSANVFKRKKELRSELNQIEKQIYDLETSYLEETKDFGNIFTGWDAYLSFEKIKVRKTVLNEERLFSLSSVTSPASKKEENKKHLKEGGEQVRKRKKSKGNEIDTK